MLKNATIRTKLLGVLGLMAAVGLVISLVGARQLSGINGTLNEIVDVTSTRATLSAAVRSDLLKIHRAEKSLILAEEIEEMERYAAAIDSADADLREHLAELDQLATPEGKALIADFRSAADAFMAESDRAREASRRNTNAQAFRLSTGEGARASDRAEAALQSVSDAANSAAEEAAGKSDVASQRALRAAGIMQRLISFQRTEKDVILAPSGEVKLELDKKRENGLDGVAAAAAELRATSPPQLAERMAAFETTLADYREESDRVGDLALAGKPDEAGALSAGDARDAFYAAEADLNSYIEGANESATAAAARAREARANSKLAARAIRNLIALQRDEKDMILARTTEEMDEFAASMVETTAEIEAGVAELLDGATPELARNVDAFSDALDASNEISTRVAALSRENSNEIARQISATTGRDAFNVAAEKMEAIAQAANDSMVAASKESDAAYASAITMMYTIAAIGLITGAVLGFLIIRGIVNALMEAVEFARVIASGKLDERVEIRSHDETGTLSMALNEMAENLQQDVQSLVRDAESLANASTELAATATQLAGSAEETTNQSSMVSASSEQMATNMTQMSASAEQMNSNVQTVASAVEEMTVSIREIAQNAEQAANVAGDASGLATTSNQKIGALGEAADEIGKVIGTIQDIAEQTNLLALNATIEAARAGDAGKGFAVVATEVKELAKQTAEATEDIRGRIEGIQGSSAEAVAAMERISEVIGQVNSVSTTIASAVEEQSITTREISENVNQTATAVETVSSGVQQSATASQEITRNISGVDQAARNAAEGASQTQTASEDLSRLSENIMALTAKFTV